MPKEPKDKGAGQYGQVVARLQQIVEELEAGELPLEESIARFEAGMALAKQAETILGDAEKRVEQLLSDDGRTAPLKSPDGERPAAPAKAAAPVAPADLDDVPF